MVSKCSKTASASLKAIEKRFENIEDEEITSDILKFEKEWNKR